MANFAIYGAPGSGKSRLAASAMRADPKTWGPRAFYVAIDNGSEELRPILAADKGNLVVHTLGVPGQPMDPYKEVCRIFEDDLPNKNECDTVILDTMTSAAADILQAIANSGKYSDKHIIIDGGKLSKLAVPMQGDYGATTQSVMNILRLAKTQRYNLICVFHDGLFEPESTSSAPTVGGPKTAGSKSIVPVASWFDNLVRTEAKGVGTGADRKVEYWVATEKKGPFLAKLRVGVPVNPIPDFKLEPDPVNFWNRIKELQ